MKVAVGRAKHSPMFGQRASSQTVVSFSSRRMRRSGRASRRMPRFFAAQAGRRGPAVGASTRTLETEAERSHRGHELPIVASAEERVVVAAVHPEGDLEQGDLVVLALVEREDGRR